MKHHPALSSRSFARIGLATLTLVGYGGTGNASPAYPALGAVQGGRPPKDPKGGADYRLAVGGWPKGYGDAGNSCVGGGSGAVGTIGWTASLGAAPVGPIVVAANGAVYAASGGVVSAISAGGEVQWQKEVAGTVSGLLLTRGGQLVVSADKLTSLNTNGKSNWTFPDDFGVSLSPYQVCSEPGVLSDGTLIVAPVGSSPFALNPYTREVRWHRGPLTTAESTAVAADDTVIVRNYRQMVGLDGATGAQKFSIATTPEVDGTTNGAKLVYTNGFYLRPAAWGKTFAYEEAVFRGNLHITSNKGVRYYSYTGTWTSKLNLVSTAGTPAGSRTVATFSSNSNNTAFPSYPKMTALAGGQDGRYVVTNASTAFGSGWSVPAYYALAGSTDAARVQYVAEAEAAARVKAVDGATGALRWTVNLPAAGTARPPAIGPDGSLYVGTTDGRLVQVR